MQVREKALQFLIKTTQNHHINLAADLVKKLDLFTDSNGVMRVGGRLSKSNLSYEEKHPVILPGNSHLTQLIIDDCHKQIGHGGQGMTTNCIRSQGYWVTGCRKVVSTYIYNCVICRRLRAKTETQKMADLPKERTEPSPPFAHCACDVFGPFEVKEGRKCQKKYGLLFTCMASRAVHVEMLDDISTDSFISAFRCLQAIRGPIKSLYSDQGSNFKGAQTELRKAYNELTPTLAKTLADAGQCEFKFNTPTASHMGGVYERQIRTVRNVLQGIIKENNPRLDSSGLRTLFLEATAIVNSRPLTTQGLYEPNGPRPITPNHLLTMKEGILTQPPGKFESADTYSRKRWRRVQHLSNQFWLRWRREYLSSLQPRQKWETKQTNISINSVVLVMDSNVLRCDWQLGRVIDVKGNDDNLVRSVTVKMSNGTVLERPIHKCKMLVRPK